MNWIVTLVSSGLCELIATLAKHEMETGWPQLQELLMLSIYINLIQGYILCISIITSPPPIRRPAKHNPTANTTSFRWVSSARKQICDEGKHLSSPKSPPPSFEIHYFPPVLFLFFVGYFLRFHFSFFPLKIHFFPTAKRI